MNGRNKYWREARWDKNQPERLAHIKEKRSKSMMKVVQGTFQQIPYWKLRGRFHSCGFRDQEIANAIGIGTDTMSKRMNGKQPWTSTEIAEICKTLDIPQDEIGELFFPTVEKGESA